MDDAAFILLNRKDLEEASRLIVTHFRRFGLTVHAGSRSKNCGPKTEAMYIRRPKQPSEPNKKADIIIDEDSFFEFTTEFKYLGNIINETLDDTPDIKNRIKKASQAFGAMKQNIFQNLDISIKLRMRFYNAIIVNLALWGCESWALKASDIKLFEVFHNRCLRAILRISRIHRVITTEIRKQCGDAYTMESVLEFRRCRWLHKIALMDNYRNPRRFLAAWYGIARLKERPQQTIRHGYKNTLKTLGYSNDNL